MIRVVSSLVFVVLAAGCSREQAAPAIDAGVSIARAAQPPPQPLLPQVAHPAPVPADAFRVELADRPAPFVAPEGCITNIVERNVMVGLDPTHACHYDTEDGFSISFDIPPRDARVGNALPDPGDTFDTRIHLPNAEYARAIVRITRLELPFAWAEISPKPGAALPRGVRSFGGVMKIRRDPELDGPDEMAIVPAPIPTSLRLAPCAITLTHTTYDETTRRPTRTQRPVARFVRRWTPNLRDTDWRDVAPLPLTLRQARTMLDHPTEHSDPRLPGPSIVVLFGGGDAFSYQLDAAGRTIRVDWDPSADSSDYAYEYRYECPGSGPAARSQERPHYEDSPAAP